MHIQVSLKITTMKLITLSFLLVLSAFNNSFSQTTYSVVKNTEYSAACTNCTFNIASGVTLSINKNGTCANCTFTGGSVAIKENMICQPCSFNSNTITMADKSLNPNSSTTTFSNVTFTISGAGFILANTPVTITNSTFVFNNTSYFNNNGGQLDITNSTLDFYNSAYFNANAGPVNLWSGSLMVAGDGSKISTSYIKFNGPTLNIEDASSSVIMAAANNYYFNWSSFTAITAGKSFATANKTNCGAAGQNACVASNVYGPITANAAGFTIGIGILPVKLTNFSVIASTNNTTIISWTTEQETNSAYFAIERSANGANWQVIGTVDAKGNNPTISNYSYTDLTPTNGVTYYRLKMVDLDNKYMYSEIKVIRTSLVKEISFFPNPARNYVNVSLSASAADVSIQLINQSGQILQERKVAAGNAATVSLQVQQYTPGMYILKVAGTDGSLETSKLIIAH
jgi:hypothetical protein